ncbi:MAG: glutaredoxin family protein [Chloroflexi bacterium]|nr:MAG: glutaredoxin family protein [Chloroflexota bacterium]
MTKSSRIILYTSDYCTHSWAVERFLEEHEIPVKLLNIDRNPKARKQVMKINNGDASVPTLVFPDGTTLTEPSFGELRYKLGIQTPSLKDRILGLFGRNSE